MAHLFGDDKSRIEIARDLLWENPNPTDEFSAKMVSINPISKVYDAYEIVTRHYVSNNISPEEEIFKFTGRTQTKFISNLPQLSGSSSGELNIARRGVNLIAYSNKVIFNILNATRFTIYGNGVITYQDSSNSDLVPYRFYGIKELVKDLRNE